MFLLGRFEDLERAEERFVDGHHGSGIVKLSAVIRSTKEGDELSFREEFVSILYNLMRSADEVHVVLL